MESAQSIAELYAEHTQGSEPAEEHVAQLLALLEHGETVLFTCGWTEMSEKWGPPAQLTVTTRRIVDQRWAGAAGRPRRRARSRCATCARCSTARAARPRCSAPTRSSSRSPTARRSVWEHLTNHQIEPAAAAIEAALSELQ